MKAHKGTRIICKCGIDAGYFQNAVPDTAHIKTDDIRFDGPVEADTATGTWMCTNAKCKGIVAQRLSEDR